MLSGLISPFIWEHFGGVVHIKKFKNIPRFSKNITSRIIDAYAPVIPLDNILLPLGTPLNFLICFPAT